MTKLTADEQQMLDRYTLVQNFGATWRTALRVDQQLFTVMSTDEPGARKVAVWTQRQLAIALARMVVHELSGDGQSARQED